MSMRRILKLGAVLSMTVLSVQAFAGSATPSTILVIPARARMVQLAFQVSAVKDVGLVSYDNNAMAKDLLIHVWNGHEWIRITADEYTSGAFMSGTAKDVFILGSTTTVPAVMTVDPTWGKTIHRIAELDSAPILNELGKVMNFTPSQWKWLAEKNGMILTDHNAERRRYGRWGKSGVDTSAIPRAAALAPAVTDVITMPPSEPIVEPVPVTAIQAPVPAQAPIAPQIATPPVAPVVEPPAAPAPAAPAPAVVDPTTK
jgi:hypothetical protein